MKQLKPVLLVVLLLVVSAAAFAEPAPAPAATPEFLALIGAAPAGGGNCGSPQVDLTQIGVPNPHWNVCDPGVQSCTGAGQCPACPGAGCVKACIANCCDCVGDC